MRRAVQEEDRGRGGHRVDDADHGLLRDTPLARPREREDRRAGEREAERHPVGDRAVQVGADEVGSGRAEGRHLGQRDVDEDDLAGDHVEPEVAVDEREDQAGEERQPHQAQVVGQHAPSRPTAAPSRGCPRGSPST